MSCDALLHMVAALEALDAAGGVHDSLFAGEERMAAAAYLNAEQRLRGLGLPLGATCAVDCGVYVFGMDLGLHFRFAFEFRVGA